MIFLTSYYIIYSTTKKTKLALSVFHPHKKVQVTYKHHLIDMDLTFLDKI